MRILLASQSPRRKELLEKLGYNFEVISIDCNEQFPSNLPVKDVAGFLSELKANTYTQLSPDEILITADTVVTINNHILGKPKDSNEAEFMLKMLSGKTHQVYTAITLKTMQKSITKTDVAHVELLPISTEEIRYYIQTSNPMDKAGSYGIQEWLGMSKIKSIQGSFYTIMGLPTHLIYQILKDLSHHKH